MAPPVLTQAEKEAAMEAGTSELKFLLDRHGVDTDLQALLFHSKIVTMNTLATIVSKPEELRELVKDEFGIDSASNLQSRVKVANLVVAWDAACARMKKQSEIEGELATKHLVKPLSTNEYTAMRQAWEKRYWVLDEEFIPARTYLEKRAEDLEQEEFKAEPLSAVLAKDQDDTDVLVPVWSSTGNLTMKKGATSSEEPKNPEQLRKRMKILSIGMMFLGIRHSNRGYLQGLNPQLFEDYVTYLLSEHCYAMQGKSAEGFTISGPSWGQLLIYEFQVRRRAWQRVQNENMAFRDALRTSWMDPVVKERYLTTPVALTSAGQPKRSWEASGNDSFEHKRHRPGGKGKAKGKGSPKGKGKGKGKSAADKLGISSQTPDGKHICYGYNDFAVRCRTKGCRFAHVCGACFGNHPAYACKPGSKAETQGSGRGSE